MPRDATEENAWKERIGNKKRNPTRRDPEKRRQQNIIAQRKYSECKVDLTQRSGKHSSRNLLIIMAFKGEKLRERLGKLDALESSVAQDSPTTDTVQSDTILGRDAADFSITGSAMVASLGSQSFLQQSDSTTSSLGFWDLTTHLTPSDKAMSSISNWDPTLWDYTSEFSPSDASPSTLAISDTIKHLSSSETPLSAQGASGHLSHLHPSIGGNNRSNDSLDEFYLTTTVECNCPNPHIQVQTRDCVSFNSVEVRILRVGPISPPPDPYTNHLRLETICTLTAMDSLRMHVGMTEGMMCEDEGPSPFYRPIRASADDTTKQDMICTVQRIFKTLKPDLRPSSEQITVDHPPYIDVLPFRTLRKNLILRQQEVDEDEFLRDAVTGLVCWGGAGLSRKDRDASTGYVSNGTPWDNRSWEAKAWFLKKYWSLLGGEEGELVQQSEWWRNIRGEAPLIIETLV